MKKKLFQCWMDSALEGDCWHLVHWYFLSFSYLIFFICFYIRELFMMSDFILLHL